MIGLIKLEVKKLIYYRTFWVLVILYIVLFSIVLSGLENIMGNVTIDGEKPAGFDPSSFNINTFPTIWHNLAYVAGFFRFILAVIIVISVTNEYTYRTARQNIIDGLSRLDFLLSKLSGVLILSLGSTLLLFVICLMLGIRNTEIVSFSLTFENSGYILAYFVEIFAYLIIALFLSLIIKKSGLSIGLLLLYSFIIEPLVGVMLPEGIGGYLPIAALDDLIQAPFMKFFTDTYQENISVAAVGLAIFYAAIFLGLSYGVLKRRDL